MKCKLPNFMLSLRKISQHINEATCKWIPLPPLDREWNDEDIYTYFNLLENEVKLIKETKINGYNDVKHINENELKIIKDGRKQYYLIDTKLYNIKKDKTQGDLFGIYINDKIIEGFDNVEFSDKNIIINKVEKKKTTTKKNIINKIKKEDDKTKDIETEKPIEIKVKNENNILIEDDKSKVKFVQNKVKEEDNIIIEDDKPKVKIIKKIKKKE